MVIFAQNLNPRSPKWCPIWSALIILCHGRIHAQSTPLVSELASEVYFKGLQIRPEAGHLEVLTPNVVPELQLSAHTRVEIHPELDRDELDVVPEKYEFFDYRFILHRPAGDTSSEAVTTRITFEAAGKVTPIHELHIQGLSAWADSKIVVGLLGQGSKYSYDFGMTHPSLAYLYTGDGGKIEKLSFHMNTIAELEMVDGVIPLAYEMPYSFNVSAWASSGQIYNSRAVPETIGVGTIALSMLGLLGAARYIKQHKECHGQ